LQYANVSIADEVKHIADLQKELKTLRDSWDSILNESKTVASNLGLNGHFKKKIAHNRRPVDNYTNSSSECSSDEERVFKIEVYYATL